MNKLYYGDNLSIMEGMPKYSVDLVYLDPPFKSQQNYNLLYKTLTGKPVPEQAEAFCDTWEMDAEKERVARSMPVLMREYGVEEYYVEFWRLWMQALRHTQPHLLAYLIYMVRRLLHMKIILKPTGSIYLHCDPEASHYIKVMMDGIFGHKNFRSEIIWKRTSAHSSAKRYGPVHDVILYYTAGDAYTWNPQYQDYDDSYLDAFYTHVAEDGRRWRRSDLTGAGVRHGATGEPWRGRDVTAKGRHWAYPPDVLDEMDKEGKIHWPQKEGGMPMLKRYADEGKGVPIQDIWTDIKPIHNLSAKRLGYPTQKPMALLDRIIRSSTNEGEVVFDPFCGCGTTVYAAHEAGREWIGCDVAILAVRLVEHELKERYGLVKGEHYVEEGIPNSASSAVVLFEKDPFQFEHWAVEYVGGFPTKKTGDLGVDGRIYFETGDRLGVMVLSVKGGNIRPTDIRDLVGVLASEEGAELAGFISNKQASKAMQSAAAKAGTWEYKGVEYPRVQLLTVKEIVEDKKRFHTPTKIGVKSKDPQTKLAM
jgi:DNA modification methylase